MVISFTYSNFQGTEYTFRGYGIATIIVLIGYAALNYFYIRKYTPDEGPTDISAIEETHLAPYGVPISLSHSRSNTNMDDEGKIYIVPTSRVDNRFALYPARRSTASLSRE